MEPDRPVYIVGSHLMPEPEDVPTTPSPASDAEIAGPVEILKSIGEVAGVLTGIAFITGWLYWSTYYSSFGLNPLELGFSVAVVSVSPIQVILRDWKFAQLSGYWIYMGALGGYMLLNVVLVLLFVRYRTSRHPRGPIKARGTLLALAVGMFAGGYLLGRYDANVDSGCLSRLPNVAFLTSASNPPTDADAAASCLDNELTCKLVLHANSTYYYFENPECSADSAGNAAGFATAALPDTEVRMIRVQRTIGW
jgi:hypothetical protein